MGLWCVLGCFPWFGLELRESDSSGPNLQPQIAPSGLRGISIRLLEMSAVEAPTCAVRAGSQKRGLPGEAPHSGLQRRREEARGNASEKQMTQRARVLRREVTNYALIIVRRAEEASVHTEQDSPLRVGPRSAGPRQVP